jgi:hypothetical protein
MAPEGSTLTFRCARDDFAFISRRDEFSHCLRYGGSDVLRCTAQWIGIQMGVALCRARLRVPKELADDWEARTASAGNGLGVKQMGQPKPEPGIITVDARSAGQQSTIPIRPHLAGVGRQNRDRQVRPLVGAVALENPGRVASVAAGPPDALDERIDRRKVANKASKSRSRLCSPTCVATTIWPRRSRGAASLLAAFNTFCSISPRSAGRKRACHNNGSGSPRWRTSASNRL